MSRGSQNLSTIKTAIKQQLKPTLVQRQPSTPLTGIGAMALHGGHAVIAHELRERKII
ncbi:hypothetical protein SynBIOSE41_03770 [Synechococcus sp. BIOS-E4-1]|nr:hypothetical protein SynBIOSE41_03770 [Synechococcus sp. BIOS-E4-1]